MRNSRVLSASLAILSLALWFGFPADLPVFGGDKLSYTPQPFACEVRYHFREHFPHDKLGEKRVSAPAFEREGLPKSRAMVVDGIPERIVEGQVAHLPYQFFVKISRRTDSEAGTLEVSVLDSSGKPVTGFPQVMPNPLTKSSDTSRKELEIPIDHALKEKIEKSLLAKEQFITHVDLIVGMDDDFLSQPFPE